MAPDNLYTGTALNNAHLNESYEVRDLWDSLLNYHHCFANRVSAALIGSINKI